MNENVKSLIDDKDKKENDEITVNVTEFDETNDITNTAEEETEAEEITRKEEPEENGSEKGFLECTVAELYEISKSFPDQNIMEDISSESFKIFANGHTNASPKQIYSDYVVLKNEFSKQFPKQQESARVISGQETGTRAHSGFDTYASGRNVMCGLTKRQMEIARENGMSYREYEELLDSVPKTRMR